LQQQVLGAGVTSAPVTAATIARVRMRACVQLDRLAVGRVSCRSSMVLRSPRRDCAQRVVATRALRMRCCRW